MTILDRHIALRVLLTTLFGVVVLSLVLVLGNAFRKLLDLIVNQNLSPGDALHFMMLVLPFSLIFTIPWGFLTALLLVFGRMSADNELIAIQSIGISIPRLCTPVFFISIALSGFCLLLNIDAAPRAQLGMLSLVSDLAKKDPSSLFRPDEVIDQLPGLRIYIGGKEGNKLTDIFIFEMNEEGALTRMIAVREGSLSHNPEKAEVLLHFSDARFEERDKTDPSDVTKVRKGMMILNGTYPFSLEKFIRSTGRTKPLRTYSLSELTRYIADGADGKLLKARVEYHRRFSLSLACAAFALVAVPLGIIAHRKETSVGFGISLVLAFTYFFFIMLAQSYESTPGAHPVFLIWFPNILFGLLGGGLFLRLVRQ